jgi:hypothetical protein
MATNDTPWIHVIKNATWPPGIHCGSMYEKKFRHKHSHEVYQVDLCVDTNHQYSIATWTMNDEIQGLQTRRL